MLLFCLVYMWATSTSEVRVVEQTHADPQGPEPLVGVGESVAIV